MSTQHKLKDLLLPERVLTAKLIFDNIRNYAICAGFLALTVWLDGGAKGIPAYALGSNFHLIAPYTAYAAGTVGTLLFLLNVGQSIELGKLAIDLLDGPFAKVADLDAESSGPIMSRVLSIVSFIGVFLFLVAVLALAGAFALVTFLLFVYSAGGHQT